MYITVDLNSYKNALATILREDKEHVTIGIELFGVLGTMSMSYNKKISTIYYEFKLIILQEPFSRISLKLKDQFLPFLTSQNAAANVLDITSDKAVIYLDDIDLSLSMIDTMQIDEFNVALFEFVMKNLSFFNVSDDLSKIQCPIIYTDNEITLRLAIISYGKYLCIGDTQETFLYMFLLKDCDIENIINKKDTALFSNVNEDILYISHNSFGYKITHLRINK